MMLNSSLILHMTAYFASDIKRINHFLKVYALAKTIGENEKLDDSAQEILEVAAIIHDIGIKVSEEKYGSSDGHYQEIEGPFEARKMLEGLDYEEVLIEKVCFIVGKHHTYQNISMIEHQILVEADFLVNIAEEGMSMNQIKSIKERIFKTKTGKKVLGDLYL